MIPIFRDLLWFVCSHPHICQRLAIRDSQTLIPYTLYNQILRHESLYLKYEIAIIELGDYCFQRCLKHEFMHVTHVNQR